MDFLTATNSSQTQVACSYRAGQPTKVICHPFKSTLCCQIKQLRQHSLSCPHTYPVFCLIRLDRGDKREKLKQGPIEASYERFPEES